MNAGTKQQAGKGRSLNILVADDEQDTVRTLAAILEDEGHTVHTVTHGGLVRDAIARFNPEVCILDIEMPGESGYSLAKAIANTTDPDRPVLIAISGKWKSPTDMLLARMVGFDHFFSKPADPGALIDVLDLLREERPKSV